MPTAAQTPNDTPVRSPVRAAILAGGTASRMGGRPKGLVEIGGERILDRLVRRCKAALGATPLLVANAADASTWLGGAVPTVPDARPGSGTLGGLYTAALHAPAPVVCIAWDMPFVTEALIARLAHGLESADVFLPESENRRGVEPLCGGYGPAVVGPMAASIDRGDFRAVAFHRAVRVGILPLEEVATFGDPFELFFNVNTPEDLERAGEIEERARRRNRGSS